MVDHVLEDDDDFGKLAAHRLECRRLVSLARPAQFGAKSDESLPQRHRFAVAIGPVHHPVSGIDAALVDRLRLHCDPGIIRQHLVCVSDGCGRNHDRPPLVGMPNPWSCSLSSRWVVCKSGVIAAAANVAPARSASAFRSSYMAIRRTMSARSWAGV